MATAFTTEALGVRKLFFCAAFLAFKCLLLHPAAIVVKVMIVGIQLLLF